MTYWFRKHADHDQKDHGNWADGEGSDSGSAGPKGKAGKTTPMEQKMLHLIVHSEYQDGQDAEDVVDHPVWTRYIVDRFGGTKKASGVMSSLQKKGYIKTTGAGDPQGSNPGAIWITQKGHAAFMASKDTHK